MSLRGTDNTSTTDMAPRRYCWVWCQTNAEAQAHAVRMPVTWRQGREIVGHREGTRSLATHAYYHTVGLNGLDHWSGLVEVAASMTALKQRGEPAYLHAS